jgi:predicted nucleic acid-binding protein
MQIIVSDSSCLIDLRKASLLEAFLGLPYEIVIPDTLFEEELLKFSAAEKALLLDGGMKVVGLPGEGVLRAQEVASQFSALSIHDCFALTLAERNPGCILLTGDALLRSVADGNGIEVHGVLWAIEEMHKASTATVAQIVEALQLFESNPVIFRLPLRDLRVFIKRYKSSIE